MMIRVGKCGLWEEHVNVIVNIMGNIISGLVTEDSVG